MLSRSSDTSKPHPDADNALALFSVGAREELVAETQANRLPGLLVENALPGTSLITFSRLT